MSQVRTKRISVRAIMTSPEFELGFEDVRNGVPFDWRNVAWDYERGRLFARIAPLNMLLWIRGQLNPKAVALCGAAFRRNLLL
jgi:hypothetical protein